MKKDVWKFSRTKQKLYGLTDLDTHTISVNKQWHKSKWNHAPGVKKNKDGTANLLDSELHEILHSKHPRMREKNIRKLTRKKGKKMGKKAKQRIYNKFN